MLRNTKLRLGAVASLAIAAMAFGAMPANADPVTPPFPTLAGAGSDTTQDVVTGVSTLAPIVIGNWDAVGGAATIQTKLNGPFFQRPNGSGDGVFALSQSIQGSPTVLYNGQNIANQLDFARSSSDPSGTTGVLTYIPFATDAVTYAYNGASTFPTDVPQGTTTSDSAVNGVFPFTLRNIYACRVVTFSDAAGNDVAIAPLIPQAGSGTRSYWLRQVGQTEATVTSGGCVTSRNNSVQEHDGRALTGLGDIMPYSIGQYIAQGRHLAITTSAVVERRGNAVLGKVGTQNPFRLTGATLTLNPNFPIRRLVYNVVQTTRVTEAAIAATFVGPNSTFCNAAGVAMVQSYGFAAATNCGITTILGAYRTAP